MAKVITEKRIKAEAAKVRETIPENFQLTVEEAFLIAGELKGTTGVLDVIELAYELGYSRRDEVQKLRSGSIMRAFRGARSADEVARVLGIGAAALIAYENGEQFPRDEVKVRIADYYDVPVDVFFE